MTTLCKIALPRGRNEKCRRKSLKEGKENILCERQSDEKVLNVKYALLR